MTEKILRDLGAQEGFIKEIFTNPLFFTKEIFEWNGKIIGASVVRLTSEISIFFDKDAANIGKAAGLKYFINTQVPKGKELGIDQVLAFTSMDKCFMNHIGFKERDETPYILHF